MKAMASIIRPTDSNNNNTDVTMDQGLTNSTTPLSLNVNHDGPFTLHYIIWPYTCLFLIMVLVWLSIYLSILYSRRHPPKTERQCLSSVYTTQNSTTVITGGADESEDPTVLTSVDA